MGSTRLCLLVSSSSVDPRPPNERPRNSSLPSTHPQWVSPDPSQVACLPLQSPCTVQHRPTAAGSLYRLSQSNQRSSPSRTTPSSHGSGQFLQNYALYQADPSFPETVLTAAHAILCWPARHAQIAGTPPISPRRTSRTSSLRYPKPAAIRRWSWAALGKEHQASRRASPQTQPSSSDGPHSFATPAGIPATLHSPARLDSSQIVLLRGPCCDFGCCARFAAVCVLSPAASSAARRIHRKSRNAPTWSPPQNERKSLFAGIFPLLRTPASGDTAAKHALFQRDLESG